MRILHVTTYLQGGAGRAISDLAVAQRHRGDLVSLSTTAAPEPGYGNYPEYLQQLAAAGVPVSLVDSIFKRELPRLVAAATDIRRAMEAPPDVIHSHAGVASIVALLVSGATNRAPVVQTMHGWSESRLPEHSLADVLAMQLTCGVAVPSQAAAEHLIAAGVPADHLHRIPYGIVDEEPDQEPDADVAAVTQAWRSQGRKVLCSIGTLGARKNQMTLVAAVASGELRARVGVLLVGDGEPGPIHEEIARGRLQGVVLVAGHRPYAARFLREADWLVLPSRREGMPLAVLEACRAGVPAVVSPAPELREIVSDGATGIVAESHDVQALAAALKRAINVSEATRKLWGAASRQRWYGEHRLFQMIDRYDALYERARTFG